MKKHKTLGRVLEVKDSTFEMIAIGWSATQTINLPIKVLPTELSQSLKVDQRFIFWCNLEATCPVELKCEKFELAPEPDPNDGLS